MEELCKDLASKKSFPVPNTFHRAWELVPAAGKDVGDCLVQGFLAEGIVFFPQIQFRDTRRAHRLWWNFKDWVHVHSEDMEPLAISQEAEKTLQVLSEFQRRGLSFQKHLEVYKEHGMPWMKVLLSRLPKKLHGRLLLNTLTFVLCVGAIMNGAYVDYNHLLQLLQEMSAGGMSQSHLQKLQILGKFTLEKVKNAVIWKLHPDLPYRLVPRAALNPTLRRPVEEREDQEHQQPLEDVQATEEQDDIRPAVRTRAKCLPARSNRTWSALELTMINLDRKVSHKQAFKEYLSKCMANNVPARTFDGFKKRRQSSGDTAEFCELK